MSLDQESLQEELTANSLKLKDYKSFAYLFAFSKPYRFKLFSALLLLVFASLTGVLSARVLGELVEKGIRLMLAKNAAERSTLVAFRLGGIIIFLELVSVMTAYFGRLGLGESSIATIRDIRTKLFYHLQELPMNFFDKQPLGRTVTRLTYDVEGIEDFFSGTLARLLSAGISLGTVIIAMLLTKPGLGVLLFVAVSPAVILTYAIRNTVRAHNREMAHKNSTINARLWEFLNAIPVIRGFGAEKWSQNTYDAVVDDHLGASIRLNVLNAWSRPIILIMCQFPLFLLFWVGGHQVLAGTLELGLFVTFIRYCERFSRPISSLAQEIHLIQTAWVSAERVTNFLNRPTEDSVLGADGTYTTGVLKGDIEFKNVDMKYDVTSEKQVLANLNFHVKSGERIGLAGKTGSGKTSTLGLIARLYEFQGGEILIDGKPIRSFNRLHLRSHIGYVSQDVVIFKGTLRENLSMGLKVPDQQLTESCDATGLSEVLRSRQIALDSEILDQGMNLSFGERQLIALTRVLVKNPTLLILDEATANIDPKTEESVVQAVDKVMKGRTTFVIAHRLATLRNCDRILVFRDGKLVEEGTHLELEQSGGYYGQLIKSGEQLLNDSQPVSSTVH